MTYLTNLWKAFKGEPYIKQVTVTKTEWKSYPLFVKDPHGIIHRDLARIHKFMDKRPYKVGDSLDLVAYKQGQQALYDMIVAKIVNAKTYKPNGGKHGLSQ